MRVVLLLALISWINISSVYAYNSDNFNLLKIIKSNLKSYYVEKTLEDKELEYGAIKGMLRSLDDPYTRFIEPKSYKEMKVRLSGEFFGIGIYIGLRNDILTVISPISGTPAEKIGLKPLDIISKIDGKSTEDMSLEEAVSIIRGPKNTNVTLTILRKDEEKPIDYAITRKKIDIPAVEKVTTFKDDKVGYVKLNTFESKKATLELRKAIIDLNKKDIESLILDLRFNGGGLLKNAIDISSIFIKKGEVVHTIDRNNNKTTNKVSGYSLYEKPLYILINQGSASASEILAGAIKDNNRGVIVGKNSFGKASVQRVLNLPDGSAVLMTIAKYYTPKMTNISKKGITVDHEFTIPTENINLMKKKDFVYEYKTDYQLQRTIELAINESK